METNTNLGMHSMHGMQTEEKQNIDLSYSVYRITHNNKIYILICLRHLMVEDLDVETVNKLFDNDNDPAWELTIRRVNNGYILTSYNQDDGSLIRTEHIIEEKDIKLDDNESPISLEHSEEYKEAAAMREVFLNIQEFFGNLGSKHDMYRLVTKIEKQHDGSTDN